MVAAGERSEPADQNQDLSEPAKLATESFARSRGLSFIFISVSPGSLRSARG